MVQLQILDLDRPSRRKAKRLTCEGESPGNGLSQSLAGKPIIDAGRLARGSHEMSPVSYELAGFYIIAFA